MRDEEQILQHLPQTSAASLAQVVRESIVDAAAQRNTVEHSVVLGAAAGLLQCAPQLQTGEGLGLYLCLAPYLQLEAAAQLMGQRHTLQSLLYMRQSSLMRNEVRVME